ncbi:MAG: tandem-95 repeat protein, partial [Rhodospirillales bacterium]|nr:tandem-95 repeat protein [Rhodospirillales bacterium]
MAEENNNNDAPKIDDSVFDELTVLQEGLDEGLADQDGPVEHSQESQTSGDDPSIYSSIQMGSQNANEAVLSNVGGAATTDDTIEEVATTEQDTSDDTDTIDNLDSEQNTDNDRNLDNQSTGEENSQQSQTKAVEKSSGGNEPVEEARVEENSAPNVQPRQQSPQEPEQVTEEAAPESALPAQAQTEDDTPAVTESDEEDLIETVETPNTGPESEDSSATATEDTAYNGTVIATDADGDTLSYALENGPSNGTLIFNDDGTYTYTPDTDYNGTDSFSYEVSDGQGGTTTATVNLTVDPTNDTPVSEDSSATLSEDTSYNGSVSATDVDGDNLTYALDSGPSNGTLSFNDDGTYTYTPNHDYYGSDSFSYQVNDGQGGTTTATVNFTVNDTVDNVIIDNGSSHTVTGSDATETIDGGGGHDNIHGGGGDDVIRGGTGNDNMYGGEGNDTFVVKSGDGAD